MAKVVLITGASTGLGESIGNHLVQKGYIVYGTSRNIEGQKKAFKTLNMDVSNEESVGRGIERVLAEQGQIDVLINNAGLGIAGPVESLLTDDIARVLDTNVIGAVRTIQAVLPHMRDRRVGLIINISSIAAEAGLPYRGAYSASKAALDRITEALRLELAPFGVQACTVQPGGVRTDINKNRLKVQLPGTSVYKKTFERTYELIDESVSQGLAPELFGELIEKIINTPQVDRLYRLGKPLEKFSVILKRILPVATYEKMIRKHYDM
nr:SDR family oxidoreductase [uncultured Arsenicibacter sp.]